MNITQIKSAATYVASAAALLMAAPSHAVLVSAAGPTCSLTDISPTATACSGAWRGNDDNQQTDVLAEFATISGVTGWTFVGKSDDADNGPFTSNPSTVGIGTLSFDKAVRGIYGLSVKSGDAFSLYVFNADKTSSVDFSTIGTNVTITGGRNPKTIPQDLSHASLYAATVAVPEPGTYALLLAGLGAVGFVARRRST